MKDFLQKNKIDLSILLLFLLFIAFSYLTDFATGIKIVNNFYSFFIEMIIFIPAIFVLIGLFDVWFPKEKIQKHIGEKSGIKGTLLIILLAMFQGGPLYSAFPVTYILWEKGCSIKNIFIYLGAFSTIKIPMLLFETGFLGVKFSLIRSLLSLPLFILTGLILELYFKNKKFEIKQP